MWIVMDLQECPDLVPAPGFDSSLQGTELRHGKRLRRNRLQPFEECFRRGAGLGFQPAAQKGPHQLKGIFPGAPGMVWGLLGDRARSNRLHCRDNGRSKQDRYPHQRHLRCLQFNGPDRAATGGCSHASPSPGMGEETKNRKAERGPSPFARCRTEKIRLNR